MKTMHAASVLLIGLFVAVSFGQTVIFDTPSDDRWHYPFNATPGNRGVASVFGAPALNGFNDRDGSVYVGWDTTLQIEPNQGPENYEIASVVVVVTNEAGAVWPIDVTVDEWFSFDLDGDDLINGDGVPRGEVGDVDGESDDDDPGRPVELFGLGFGPDFTETGWNETTVFVGSNGTGNFQRDPFPMTFDDATGEMLHIEDHVKGLHNDTLSVFEFTPEPWAIGVPIDYEPGSQAEPFEIRFEVDLDLADGRVREYFQRQLDTGRVLVSVTTLLEVFNFGDPGEFLQIVMKEGVDTGLRAPARLEITLGPAQLIGDMNCDGTVTVSDINPFVLALTDPDGYMAQFPDCNLLNGDVDGSGGVTVSDINGFVALLTGS